VQAVGGQPNLTVLIGRVEQWAALITTIKSRSPSNACLIQAAKKMLNHYIFTLKTATSMFSEIMDNFQLLKWLIPKS
jgi:hypothetical protein